MKLLRVRAWLQIPVAERGALGRLEHLLAAHSRGELQALPWLDTLTLAVGGRLSPCHGSLVGLAL